MQTKVFFKVTAVALSAVLSACSGGGGGGASGPTIQTPPVTSSPPPPTTASNAIDGFDLVLLGILEGAPASQEGVAARSVAFDSSGAMYITGRLSTDTYPFPDPNAFDTSLDDSGGTSSGSDVTADAVITKFSPSGQHVWSTAFGGPNHDRTYAIEIDESGPNPGVVIAGRAGDLLPTTAGVLQPNFAGDSVPSGLYGQQDGFVAKFSMDGRNLLWATYFGGPGAGFIRSMDVDSQGRVHIGFVGIQESLPYITPNAVRTSRLGTTDAVYAVISEDGSNVEYATYMGGTSTGSNEPLSMVQVIENNGVFQGTYFTFNDNAPDVATTAGVFQPNAGGAEDMVIAKLDNAFQLEWMSYLGGSDSEFIETNALAIDGQGRPVIIGATHSTDFPTTSNAFSRVFAGGLADGFVSIVSADGQSLDASSFFGGSEAEEFEGVDVLSDGTLLVAGSSFSSDIPGTAASFQTFLGGDKDGLLIRWSADLRQVLGFTYLGGTGFDRLRDVTVGPNDNIGIAGEASSSPFPTVNTNDSSVDQGGAAVFGRLEPN